MAEHSTVSLFSCKEDEDKFERERCWSECPNDLLIRIFERLPWDHRCTFNSVCKSWKSIDTVLLPPPVHSPYFDSPCLMLSKNSNEITYRWKLFHSVYNDSYYLDFPELLNAEICYAKYGWLLMSQGERMYFFFNPITRVKKELPSTRDSFLQVCFTSPPTSANDCVIFGIFSSSNRMAYQSDFGIIKFGEKEWTVYEYPNKHVTFTTNCSPVFCNGLFYCLDQSGNMGVFNPNNEESHWVQYKKCVDKKTRYNKVLRQSYMAEVEGEILGVFFTHQDGRVGVYKLDMKEIVWRPLQSLGNKCLYVSPNVSFAEICDVKSLADKIYFNMFHGHRENGVVYSLVNKMYQSVEGSFTSKDAYALREEKHGTWFKPGA